MEFQGIVMAAGKGSRIMEITSGLPKCLLPIGNLPLIRSSIRNLKNLGIQNVIVLVPEAEKVKIQETIDSKCDSKVEVVGIPKNDDWGTADSLRYIQDKIHSDVLIMSCDVVTNFDFTKMANLHRKHDSSLTMLLFPLPKTFKDAVVPGHKGKNKPEKDIIGMDHNGRLIFFNSEADFENGVPMKMSILRHHPYFQVFSNLMDAHVYMMKKAVVDFIVKNKQMSTIKGEFLPVIVSKQFSRNPLSSVDPASANEKQSDYNNLKNLALELSSFNCQMGSLDESYCCDPLKCFAYIEREAYCIRANTLVGYLEVNRQIAKHIEAAMGIPRTPSIYPKSQVDNDSIVGEECILLTKSSIKQSVIGNNCSFSEKVKISSSVVMDCVSVQAGSSIQGCIICSNVSIGSNCELKSCVVGPGQTINDSTKLINEVVQSAYQLMEV